MKKDYLTVLGDGASEYQEKKSRFIAAVKPVLNENDAIEFINNIRTKYSDASHNVYAYRIIGESILQKYSDDKEPSGTAGLPVMEAIKKTDVYNLVVVVTRYFGGTLLGTAGLIRAYGKAALLGIQSSGIAKRQFCTQACINLDYNMLGKIQNIIIENSYMIKDIEYGENINMTVFVPVVQEDDFISIISEATNGKASVKKIKQLFITIDNNKKIMLNNPL